MACGRRLTLQHPAFWGQPMTAEQRFNVHNTFPLPIGASHKAEPVSHTQSVPAGPHRPPRLPELTVRQPLVTGTSVLGIKYKDGVMLAADNLGKQIRSHVDTRADLDSIVWIIGSIQGYPASTSSWKPYLSSCGRRHERLSISAKEAGRAGVS